MLVHPTQASSSDWRQTFRICVTGKCFPENPISPARYDTALRETAMARSTAKARTAPSAPRQGQRSTTSELSRTLRVRSPLAGKSVFAGEKVQRLHPRARQKKTAQPPSVRLNPKGLANMFTLATVG